MSISHAANKRLAEIYGETDHYTWEDAPDWYREFYLKGVRNVLDNPDGDGRAHHEAWMRDKMDAGWVYGPVTDRPNKVHNCLIPYDDLPPCQKAKDDLFRGIVLALPPLSGERGTYRMIHLYWNVEMEISDAGTRYYRELEIRIGGKSRRIRLWKLKSLW